MKLSKTVYIALILNMCLSVISANAAIVAGCVEYDNCYVGNFGTVIMDFEISDEPLLDQIHASGPLAASVSDEILLNETQVMNSTLYLTQTNQLSSWGLLSPNYAGSRALFNNTNNGTISIQNNSGFSAPSSVIHSSTFDFTSIDLSEVANNSEYGVTNITFMGRRLSGDVVSQSVTLDNIFGMETFHFGDTFNDVTRIWWNQTPEWHQFDNIVFEDVTVTASAVPVPAAVWLFGSGLLGLVGFARRKKV